VSTLTIAIPARTKLDSINPDTLYPTTAFIGELYVGGAKSFNLRSIFRVDLSSLAGWTSLTAARLVGGVLVQGSSFAATLRQVTEEFTYTEASYNHRTAADHWATAGADLPNSATDTNKTAFTSPAAAGLQTIVSGAALLALVQSVGTGILRFHIRADVEDPGVNRVFSESAAWYLEVDGTAPAGTALGALPSGTLVAASFTPAERRFGSVPSTEVVNPAAGARRLGAVPSDELVPNSWV